jgi:transposase
MFSYISAERRVPEDHPLSALRVMADAALAQLGPGFDAIYARSGRPSIAPEKLLRALLLQVLYTVVFSASLSAEGVSEFAASETLSLLAFHCP